MTRCYITLDECPSTNRNLRMKDKAARALYGTDTFQGRLEVTRKEFFAEGVKCIEGMSISGVQQKLSLILSDDKRTLTPTQEGGRFILKPSPDAFPNCAEMEHLGMRISALVGIETAACGLVEFKDRERAYVTRRFDRDHAGAAAVDGIEDLCSLSDLPKHSKYDSSYEAAGAVLFQAVGGKLVVMRDYFKRVALAYLIGNDDLHLKNLSVIRKLGNTGLTYDKLSPNYDVVPTIVYGQSTTRYLAMDLLEADRAGHFSDDYQYFGYYTYSDFMALAKSLSLAEKPADKVLRDLAGKVEGIEALIVASFASQTQKDTLIEEVRKRARALLATRATISTNGDVTGD